MSAFRRYLRIVLSAFSLAAVSLGLTCSDSAPPDCPIEDATAYWSFYGYDLDITQPQCPISIPGGGYSVLFAFTTTRPADASTDGRNNDLVTRFQNYQGAYLALPFYSNWDINPFNSSQIFAQAQGSYPAGAGAGQYTQYGYDQATQEHYSNVTHLASGRVRLTYKLGIVIASRAGPTVVNLGQSYTWTDSWYGATSSISAHAWYANGSSIAGATGQSLNYTPLAPGTLQVQHRVDEASGLWDTLTVPITVIYSASINGPSPVRSTSLCTYRYSATITGGVAPLTRQWKINGVNVGSNQGYYDATFATTGSFEVSVTVTDNVGNVTTGVKWVTVNTTAPMCAL
jgi:hypothetical protein